MNYLSRGWPALSALVLASAQLSAIPAKLGDLDEDGLATVADLSMLIRHSEALAPLSATLLAFADLNQDGAINDLDQNELVQEILESRTPQSLPLLHVRRMNPEAGEGDVAVTRETILEFSMPLALEATLGPEQVAAVFAGRPILSRVEISSDRRKASLFYLQNLPSSARIQVILNAPGLKDLLGREVDLDGDGAAGGVYAATFDTLTLTPLPNTAITGTIYASEKAVGGGDVPLAGVTITVDGAEETLRAVTNAAGEFSLSPCPAGMFFVTIDGRTSPSSTFPNGDYYPFVGKKWEALAGKTNNLSGESSDTQRGKIYLPLIKGGSLETVSPTQATVVEFPSSVLNAHPELQGVQVLVPPNALFSNDGTRGGSVGIAPVPPDRLPSPLPLGLDMPLVITIQTDGPTNFDRPVPVCFPNLPDTAGKRLPPGAKTALWSFNHDSGEWEPSGPMTVTADGNFVKTDAGTGVRQPGWHGPNPGTSASGAGDHCTPEWVKAKEEECKAENKVESCVVGCDTTASFAKFLGSGAGNCQDDAKDGKAAAKKAVDQLEETVDAQAAALGLGGPLGQLKSLLGQAIAPAAQEVERVYDAVAKGVAKVKRGAFTKPRAHLGSEDVVSLKQLADAMGRCVPQKKDEQLQHLAQLDAPGQKALEGVLPALSEVTKTQAAATGVLDSLQSALGPALDGLEPITKVLEDSLSPWLNAIAPFLPVAADGEADATEVTLAQVEALLAVVDQISPALDAFAQVSRESQNLLEAARQNEEAIMTWQNVATEAGQAAGLSPTLAGERFVKVETTDEFGADPQIQRFKSERSGAIRLILRPRAPFTLTKYDPVTNQLAVAAGWTADSGQTTELPGADLQPPAAQLDADGDGLFDAAEDVVGTNPQDADSDDDGFGDLAEVKQGTNPLDGQPAQTGVIAGAPTAGPALDIATFDDTLVVAEGGWGFEVFRAQPGGRQPVRIGSYPHSQNSAVAAAVNDRYAGVATTTGVVFVPVLEAGLPGVEPTRIPVGGVATALALEATTAFVGTREGQIVEVALGAGEVVGRLNVGSPVEDLVITNGVLYAYRQGWTVSAIPLNARPLAVSNNLGLSGGSYSTRRYRLAAAGKVLYAQHVRGWHIIDIANPTQPAVVENFVTPQFGWRHVVANGSGLGLVITGPNGSDDAPHDVGMYTVGADGKAHDLISMFGLPLHGEALAIHNGQAYLAAGTSGLFVINYRAFEQTGAPPTIALTGSVNLAAGAVEEGKILRLSAAVTDDVQVRAVDFLIDGVSLGTDGSFPFEFALLAPQRTATKTSITVQAIARDTGGKSAASPVFTLNLTPDATPPIVKATTPPHNELVSAAPAVFLTFSEAMDVASLTGANVFVTCAGADATLGTADDLTPPQGVVARSESAFYISLASALPVGRCRITVKPPAADSAGNPLAAPFTADFRLASNLDADGDGIPDDWEVFYGLNAATNGQTDLDGDTLGTALEIQLGFHPQKADTNGNGVRDDREDTDFDGLGDVAEFNAGTDPLDADSDDDTLNDEVEVASGTNPLDPLSVPWTLFGATISTGVDPFLMLNLQPGSFVPGAVPTGHHAYAFKMNTAGAEFPLGSAHIEQGEMNVHRPDDAITNQLPFGTPPSLPPVQVNTRP